MDLATRLPGDGGLAADEVAIEPHHTPRVLWWAGLGVAFVALEAYLIGSWLAVGEATATQRGSDRLPGITLTWIWCFQVASIVGATVAVVYVVRAWRKAGHITFDGLLMLGWLSTGWQDPLINYLRPQFFYNAGFVNFGSWGERVPGWVTPNGAHLAQPLLFFGGLAYFYCLFTSMLVSQIMRQVRLRRPRLSNIGLVLVAGSILTVFTLVLEVTLCRAGLYAYPGAVRGLSLWAGRTYQYPLYAAVLGGALFTATGALRYFRNPEGLSVVELGAAEVKGSDRRRTLLRGLAICGFMNACYLLMYVVPWQWFALHVDATPRYPSYMGSEICGPSTGYDCAGPTIPIPVPGSPAPHPVKARNAAARAALNKPWWMDLADG